MTTPVPKQGKQRPPKPDKPPFRVPSMAEINAVKPNGFTVATTFAGCGGSSLGYRMAGFRVVYANEFVEAARDSYSANKRKWTIVDDRDIRDVTAESILEMTGLKRGELDLLDGSPPCASFSSAGKRSAKWGKESAYSGTSQRTDDLFFEFVRILEGLQPRCFVAENVTGLVKGVAKGYFKLIWKAMTDAGYRVEARKLEAQWLGVPQDRQRIIFVGVRNDLAVGPAFPDPLPYRYSIRDALATVDFKFDVGRGRRTIESDQPAPTVLTHGNFDTFSELSMPADGIERDPETGMEIVQISGRTGPGFVRDEHPLDEPIGTIDQSDDQTRWEVTQAVGGNGAPFDAKGKEFSVDEPVPTLAGGQGGRGSHQILVDAPEGVDLRDPETGEKIGLVGVLAAEWDKMREGDQSERYFSLVRSDGDAPVQTVTAVGGTGAAAVVHGTVRRKFTLGELRRLCGFPDDFVLTGSYAQRWERLGRAVPPLMMRAVAETIRDRVLPAGASQVREAEVKPVRLILRKRAAESPGPVAVAASGGMDSLCVALAAKDVLPEPPILTSFTMDNVRSYDFKMAQAAAKRFGLEFVPVMLPSDPDEIVRTATDLIVRWGATGKAEVECLWPFTFLLDALRQRGVKTLLTGLGADGYFGLSKKVALHFAEPEKFDQYRRDYYAGPDPARVKGLNRIGVEDYGIEVRSLFIDPDPSDGEMFALLGDRPWDELNKPRQKEPLRSAFSELVPMKVRRHTNLQLGDSQIATSVGKAMLARYAPESKSPVAAYNAAVRSVVRA